VRFTRSVPPRAPGDRSALLTCGVAATRTAAHPTSCTGIRYRPNFRLRAGHLRRHRPRHDRDRDEPGEWSAASRGNQQRGVIRSRGTTTTAPAKSSCCRTPMTARDIGAARIWIALTCSWRRHLPSCRCRPGRGAIKFSVGGIQRAEPSDARWGERQPKEWLGLVTSKGGSRDDAVRRAVSVLVVTLGGWRLCDRHLMQRCAGDSSGPATAVRPDRVPSTIVISSVRCRRFP
jgi:hypothetical protein